MKKNSSWTSYLTVFLLCLSALVILSILPRLRVRAEAEYTVRNLGPGLMLQATWRAGRGMFRDAVVVLISHGDGGSIGLVLEGGLNTVERDETHGDAVSSVSQNNSRIPDGRSALIAAGVHEEKVIWGGPMNVDIYRLFSLNPDEDCYPLKKSGSDKEAKTSDIFRDLKWNHYGRIYVIDLEDAAHALQKHKLCPGAKLISGSAGWAPAQLENEIRSGTWREP